MSERLIEHPAIPFGTAVGGIGLQALSWPFLFLVGVAAHRDPPQEEARHGFEPNRPVSQCVLSRGFHSGHIPGICHGSYSTRVPIALHSTPGARPDTYRAPGASERGPSDQ